MEWFGKESTFQLKAAVKERGTFQKVRLGPALMTS